MSTAAERAFRCSRHIMPIKISVKQSDGSRLTQHVDADTRRRSPVRNFEEELMVQEVRRALNEWYYGDN